MPTYTYGCQTCGIVFEKFQSFHDQPLTQCPECEGKVRRLLQPPAIVFKGSGWYATDNRSASGQTKKSEKVESADKPADKAPAKTETAAKAAATE